MEAELLSISEYRNHLDALFISQPDNDLLLKLEWCSSDILASSQLIFDYFKDSKIDVDAFGSCLMQGIKKYYVQNEVCLKVFNSRVLSIWAKLPSDIHRLEPFWSMSYAGEPLSWGDTKQSRSIYEKMINFYG